MLMLMLTMLLPLMVLVLLEVLVWQKILLITTGQTVD